MGVAKSDSLRCVGADQILIENMERFARIDLDLSDFEEKNTLIMYHRHRVAVHHNVIIGHLGTLTQSCLVSTSVTSILEVY